MRTRGLEPRGRGTRGREESQRRGHGDAGTRERETRKRWDSGLEDVILTRSVYFHLLFQCHCFPYLVLAFVFKFIVV